MPFCTYCGQSFARDEHLERHILTHTNVKPYKCLTCHMSFARKDLLQRHLTVHGKPEDQQPRYVTSPAPMAQPAPRTPIACHHCAKTKTKCDKKFPCTRCAKRGLVCTSRPTRRVTKNGTAALQFIQSVDFQQDESSSSGQSETPGGSSDSDDRLNAYNVQPLMLPHGMPGSSFDGITPESEYKNFLRMDVGPDGYCTVPLPSPLLPDSQPMLDWNEIPYHFEDQSGQGSLEMSPMMGVFDQDVFMGDFHGSFNPHDTTPMPQIPFVAQNQAIYDAQAQERFDNVMETAIDSYIDPALGGQDLLVQASSTAPDGWNSFRCNPVIASTDCPKTARTNLQQLERSLKNPEVWLALEAKELDTIEQGKVAVIPPQAMLRDKLLAITQSFLHKALDIHKQDPGSSVTQPASNFILLPPTQFLTLFLRSFARSFEQYYSLTPKGSLDVNEILCKNDDTAASLLILLMIAQGASMISGEGQSLTAGLTEACRISLFDVVEKNIMMASDHVVLYSALLFNVQASWGGDKWLMDISQGQRGMYVNMLRHSGRLEPKTPLPLTNDIVSTEILWDDWVEQESRSRLIYAWVMVDQETSLFHDLAPMMQITEFVEPMPSSETLWRAATFGEWSSAFEVAQHEVPLSYAAVYASRPKSLHGLFRLFLDDGIIAKRIELTPVQLRLLLHPLHAIVYQARQMLSCFPDKTISRRGIKSISSNSTKVQLREATTLLARWYAMADRHVKTRSMCPTMQATLVLFHLISLNVETSFVEIEQIARRDECELQGQRISQLQKRAIVDPDAAIVHCGQILRLIQTMPFDVRPPWWAAAIYRVALVLWSITLNVGDESLPSEETSSFPHESPFAADRLLYQHPSLVRYTAQKEGRPMLTRLDGSAMPIEDPMAVLMHCTQVIGSGFPTKFTEGLRLKLAKLAQDGSR